MLKSFCNAYIYVSEKEGGGGGGRGEVIYGDSCSDKVTCSFQICSSFHSLDSHLKPYDESKLGNELL